MMMMMLQWTCGPKLSWRKGLGIKGPLVSPFLIYKMPDPGSEGWPTLGNTGLPWAFPWGGAGRSLRVRGKGRLGFPRWMYGWQDSVLYVMNDRSLHQSPHWGLRFSESRYGPVSAMAMERDIWSLQQNRTDLLSRFWHGLERQGFRGKWLNYP